MKKKLSLFLLLALSVSLLFVSCNPDQNAYSATKAFSVGSSSYDTLQEAVNSLADKSASKAVTYTITLNMNVTDPGATISGIANNLTLDFQNFTFTVKDGGIGIVVDNSDADVSISGGNIEVAENSTLHDNAPAITIKSTVKIEDVKLEIKGDCNAIESTAGEINISGTTTITTKDNKDALVVSNDVTVSVTSSDVTITGGLKMEGAASVDLGDSTFVPTKPVEKTNNNEFKVNIEKIQPKDETVVTAGEVANAAHEHTFSEDWVSDSTYHWHEATCHPDAKVSYGKHSWVDGEILLEPTDSDDGKKEQTCSVCGKTRTITIRALNHVHTYSDEWSFDENKHWHAATCQHTNYRRSSGNHEWGESTIVTEATETTLGLKTHTCTVCGAEVSYYYDSDGHTFSEAWTADSNGHWHAATNGDTDLKGDYGEHILDEGVVTTEPTEDSPGYRTYTCTVCGKYRLEKVIPNHDGAHTYSDEWTITETYHIHRSICCDHKFGRDYGEHTWDNGEITTPATETTEGVMTYTCTVCGGTKTEPIPVLDHEHTFSDAWSYDETNHWHVATCGHDVTADKTEHSWDNGKITVEATETEEGVITYTCTVCNATKTETIPVHVHAYSEAWSYDETNHWHAAECGHDVTTDVAEHTWGNWNVTIEPTYASTGTEERSCSVCGKTESRVVASLGLAGIWKHTGNYSITSNPNRNYEYRDYAPYLLVNEENIGYFTKEFGLVLKEDNSTIEQYIAHSEQTCSLSPDNSQYSITTDEKDVIEGTYTIVGDRITINNPTNIIYCDTAYTPSFDDYFLLGEYEICKYSTDFDGTWVGQYRDLDYVEPDEESEGGYKLDLILDITMTLNTEGESTATVYNIPGLNEAYVMNISTTGITEGQPWIILEFGNPLNNGEPVSCICFIADGRLRIINCDSWFEDCSFLMERVEQTNEE